MQEAAIPPVTFAGNANASSHFASGSMPRTPSELLYSDNVRCRLAVKQSLIPSYRGSFLKRGALIEAFPSRSPMPASCGWATRSPPHIAVQRGDPSILMTSLLSIIAKI